MIVHFPIPRPGVAPSDLSEQPDPRDQRDGDCAERDAACRAEGDPFRQLFTRHANHVNSAQTRGIQARLRHRLFAEDRERG